MGYFASSLGMSQIMLLAVLYRAGFDSFEPPSKPVRICRSTCSLGG